MAAPIQTTADKAGLSQVAQETTEGVFLMDFGSIKIGMGTGSPNGEVTAPIGSLFIDKANGKVYSNSDGSTTWGLVGAQTA